MAHVFWGVDISTCGHKCASCRCTGCRGSNCPGTVRRGGCCTQLCCHYRIDILPTAPQPLPEEPLLLSLSSVLSPLQSSSPWPPWPATRWRRCWRRTSTRAGCRAARGRARATAGAGPPRTLNHRDPTPSGWPQVCKLQIDKVKDDYDLKRTNHEKGHF